jgi:hypothetical protein
LSMWHCVSTTSASLLVDYRLQRDYWICAGGFIVGLDVGGMGLGCS